MTTRPAASTRRAKIAILGGGIGSLAAAWHLSSAPRWRDRYEIVVYQQGWRLGGRGAGIRNALHGPRVEQRGLHTLFGFYDNTFAMMRAAYDRLGRAPGAPLATWRDAFHPRDYLALAEPVNGGWRPWHIVCPTLPGEPGSGEPPTMWQMAMALLGWLGRWLDELASLQGAAVQGNDAARSYRLLSALARTMPDDSRKHHQHQHTLLARALEAMRARVRAPYRGIAASGDELRRLRTSLETGTTVLKGLFADGVFIKGFDSVNGIDLRSWLASHGGDPELCINSTPVRAAYDLVFAYEDGDFARPTAEAGTMLRGMLRLMLGYKGSIIFKMPAGIGATVLAPLYEVLSGRGVKFRFFHRVEELVPDGDDVGSIRMTRQVTLEQGRYNPLVRVCGLDCWPSAPDYAQIDPAQAVLLKEREVDLESYWSNWPELYRRQFGQPLPELLLERGRDFDKVVFGMSVGSLAPLCPRLMAGSAPLKAAAEQLRTVAARACQARLERNPGRMGWTRQPGGQQPVLADFSNPYDISAPMEVDPSDCYVLSVAGSAQYRLPSDGAGLANLYLAGDWLKTGLDAGCIEAAVMGGMQASRAISGYPERIAGEHDV